MWALATIDSDDGTIIIAGNGDGGIRRYHADSGQPADEIVIPGHWIRAVAPVGSTVVISLTGSLARLRFPTDS